MRGRKFLVWAVVLSLPIVGIVLSNVLRPQATAYAGHCVERSGGDLVNGCDFEIVMSFCRDIEGVSKPDHACTMQTLTVGEAFANYPEGPPEGTPYTMACRAPFPPVWKRSNSNAALWRKACGKAS